MGVLVMASTPKSWRPQHRQGGERQTQRERRERHDKWRGSAASRGYGSRWQKARATYLTNHPLCVCHLANGRVEPATVVDHVVPHQGDQKLFWDTGNWQPLCQPCHDSLKAQVEDRWLKGEADAGELRLDREMPELFF